MSKCSKHSQFFYHSLHIWYHELLTNFMIFKLRLDFIQLKHFSTAPSSSCFGNQMFEILSHFMVNVLERTEKHEYHFCTNFSLWFHALPVQIGRIRKKYIEWNKIVKYSKQSYNCAKLEHVVSRDVFDGQKKFGVEESFFLPRFTVSYIKAHGKPVVCREPHLGSRQKLLFAESLYFRHEPF